MRPAELRVGVLFYEGFRNFIRDSGMYIDAEKPMMWRSSSSTTQTRTTSALEPFWAVSLRQLSICGAPQEKAARSCVLGSNGSIVYLASTAASVGVRDQLLTHLKSLLQPVIRLRWSLESTKERGTIRFTLQNCHLVRFDCRLRDLVCGIHNKGTCSSSEFLGMREFAIVNLVREAKCALSRSWHA